jgi:hypothetical protein
MRIKTTVLAAYVVVIGSFILTRPAAAEEGLPCSTCWIGNPAYKLLYCEDEYGDGSGPGVYAMMDHQSCLGGNYYGEYELDCEGVCPGA